MKASPAEVKMQANEARDTSLIMLVPQLVGGVGGTLGGK